MLRFRAATFATALAGAAALVLSVKGQTTTLTPLDIQDVGLGAVEEHTAIWSEERAAERLARARTTTGAGAASRVGAFHRSYTPGRVIVRFRDNVDMPERRSVARLASGTADVRVRSAYADFDVVDIDPAENPETVATALNARPEVIYAQASYHVHATMKPNDPRYADLQWNLPLVDLEKAWDIQPQAGSEVTVAVVDTGVSFLTGTLTVNIPASTFEGRTYPAPGRQTIPFAAAPQRGGGSGTGRIVKPFDAISNGVNPPIHLDRQGTHARRT